VAHIHIVEPEKQLSLVLTYPKRIHASSKLTVDIHTKKQHKTPVHLTLAAVDEGVLNLTDYTTPDPVAFFYGQRKLGVEIRDVYGDLIKTIGSHATFEVGAGDDELAAILHDSVVSSKRKVVSLQSKTISLDTQGQASVTFDIPDFQGNLRLMAVAWSKSAVGSTEGKVIVKDPLSTELYMPRFIGLGDEATLTLRSSFDDTLQPGTYTFNLHTDGGVAVHPESFSYTLDRAGNTIYSKALTLTSKNQKEGTITLEVIHNNLPIAKRSWKLGVRAAYPKSYVRKVGMLHTKQTFDPAILSNGSAWLGIRALSLKLSGAPLLPTSSLSKELTAYSGRCAEQTTSRAMPWIGSQDQTKKEIVKRAIERLTSMQKISGGFGLWGNSQEETWITAYILDFLTLAQIKGYAVPQKNIRQGLKWLQQHLNRWDKSSSKQEADAYALYVLARAKQILHSEIRHHTDSPKSAIHSALAWGHLAATLASLGEQKKSQDLFDKAIASLGNYPADAYAHYGGLLRDKAALVILLKNAGNHRRAEALFGDLALDLKQRKYLSTQEMSTLLRADHAIALPKSNIKLAINHMPYEKRETLVLKAKTPSKLPKIENQGEHSVWYDLSFVATPNPQRYTQEENRGFRIEKRLYTMQGEEVTLDQIKQNSRIVIVLKGEIQDRAIHHPLITDWLPAGLEIENPMLSGMDGSDALKWLGTKSATIHSAYRDDRFEVALSMEDNNSFVAAYIARAVTLGNFTLPPAKIEDMYQPRYRAFSPFASTKIVIRSLHEISQSSQHNPSLSPKQQSQRLTSGVYVKAYRSRIGDLHHYSVVALNYLRNGIFAQAGLNFEQSNPALHKRFSVFDWYQPTDTRSSTVYAGLTPVQKKNVQALLREEKHRCGGLVLADFYRVKIKKLTKNDLKKYTKSELGILRNSLIARHGLSFKDPMLSHIFSEMPWYHPTDITAAEILDQKMSDLERANVQLILKTEQQR